MRTLGAIRGRLRRVFDSPLLALLFLHLKRRKAGNSRRPRPTNRSRVTVQRRESPWKHHIHKTSLRVPVIERQFWSEKIRKTFSYCMAIFPCAELLTWTRPMKTARDQITFCTLIVQFKPPATRQQQTGWIKHSHLQNTRLLSSFYCHVRGPLHLPPLAWIVLEWCVCWPPVLPS